MWVLPPLGVLSVGAGLGLGGLGVTGGGGLGVNGLGGLGVGGLGVCGLGGLVVRGLDGLGVTGGLLSEGQDSGPIPTEVSMMMGRRPGLWPLLGRLASKTEGSLGRLRKLLSLRWTSNWGQSL